MFDIREATMTEADSVTEQIRPLLAGRGPVVQSVILADLTAAWIAGHLLHDGGEVEARETAKLRDDILDHYVRLVRQLIPLHHARIMDANKERFHDRGAEDAER